MVSFRFRAPDKRLNGLRIPIYCCYKQISLNGVQKLQCPIVSWHDRPYIIEALFNAGDTINLDFELASIEYTKDEFLTGMLLMSQDLIKSNLDTLIEALREPEIKEGLIGDFWGFREKLKQGASKQEESLYYQYLERRGSWIGHTAQFAGRPVTPHGILGIFISGGAKIGKNCVIFQHVTIGSNTVSDSKGQCSPVLGDNVYIGAGAKIIGNVKIGNNVRIGANAVVFTDVPDNSVVVMSKPRIIAKEGMDNKFYQYYKGRYGYWLDGEHHPVS